MNSHRFTIQDSGRLEKRLRGICFHSSVGVTLGLASSAVSPCASVCFSTPPTSRLSETDGGGETANHSVFREEGGWTQRGKRRRPRRSHRSMKACGAQAAAAADSHWRGRWEAQDGAIKVSRRRGRWSKSERKQFQTDEDSKETNICPRN